jgi:hypothetical protein|tara:strand:+ start:827 stop:2062 length:1236 start_codon:yes stop_codon:yes gene_type:complete
MFNTAKKEFSANYPGLINALKNSFKNLAVKTPKFFSSETEAYIISKLNLGDNELNMLFHLSKNSHKCDDIQFEIDYDYFIHNKTKKKHQRYNLNNKIDFSDIGTKWDYIKYLNHLSVKNHLLSKYNGGCLGDEEIKAHGLSFAERLKGKSELHISTITNNGNVYDALGRPEGSVNYSWSINPMKANIIGAFDQYSDILYGYKHKSNFVLQIEIKNKDSVLYETFILLDTFNEKEIQLTDYDNVKKNIDTFLENFEQTQIHINLSKNFNTTSLVKELTGKTFLKEKNNKLSKSKIKTDFSNLTYSELTLLVNEFMLNKFDNEILVFESSGFGVNVNQHWPNERYLKPNDLVRLITQIKQTENILKNSLPEFLEKVGNEESKLLLSKTWDFQIKEAMRSTLEKFIINNKVKIK